MEELFAYILFCMQGYDMWNEFGKMLDKKVMEEPDNEDFLFLKPLLDFEQIKHYCIKRIEYLCKTNKINYDLLANQLKKILKMLYGKVNLKLLVHDMYDIYKHIPNANIEQPICSLFFYAEDYYEIGEEECRSMIEKNFSVDN